MTLSKYFISFCLLALVVSACSKKKDLRYTGPAVLEFTNPLTGVNTKTTGQSIGGASGIGGDENIPIRGLQDSVVIQLIGKQLNEELVINYSIKDGNAISGVDYEILNETPGQVILPANKSATAIKFKLLNTGTEVKNIIFELTGSGNPQIMPSANLKTFSVNIFPMKAYLNISLSDGKYISSRTGKVYTEAEAMADPAIVDIGYANISGTSTFNSPALTQGTLVDSRFSARVFSPAATISANLVTSYITLQLNSVTNATVDAIPVSGTTPTAATKPSVEIVENGIYGFVGADGKKGYIRIKSLKDGKATLDIMTQP